MTMHRPIQHNSARLTFLQQMLDNYDPRRVSTVMSPTETMVGDNYMWVGESAVEVVIASVMSSQLNQVRTVLDLPSGHGRALRHLVQLFPNADFDVCDLDEEGTEFCASEFGATIVPAAVELTETKFVRKYDLIWIGSLFTHLNWERSQRYLQFLSEQLTEKGIIVATFHGRWSMRMQELIPYTDDQRWSRVVSGYEITGYGYADYAPGLGHDFVPGSYGVSATKPDFLMKMIQAIPGVRIYHYQEKAWGENQDVIAFGRPDWSQLPDSWPKD
jgi:SAM-dependent methyltransferase